MSYRKQTIQTNDQWRIPGGDCCKCWPGVLAKDNAAVNGSGTVTTYGLVVGGTILAEDSSGLLHPCGLGVLSEPTSAANIVTVDPLEAQTFYVGDLCRVVEPGPVTRTIAVTGEADTEVFTAATVHGLIVGDSVDLTVVAGGTGYGGDGVKVVATVPSDTTFTLTGVAFSTDITDGTIDVTRQPPVIQNDTVSGGDRNVTLVDETTGEVTLSGAAFSAGTGALLVKVGAYKPAGILNDTVSTKRYVANVEVAEDRPVNLCTEADARSSKVIGLGDKLKQLLKGAPYTDPLDAAVTVVPKSCCINIRDV